MVDSQGLSFPVLSDPRLEAVDAFGVRHSAGNPLDGGDLARPAVFIADRNGTLVWRDVTENWRIRPRPETLIGELARLP